MTLEALFLSSEKVAPTRGDPHPTPPTPARGGESTHAEARSGGAALASWGAALASWGATLASWGGCLKASLGLLKSTPGAS